MVMTGKRDDPRVDAEPTDPEPKPPSWWELTGHQKYGACVCAAREGDRLALNALVEELSPLLWHVARAHGLERTQAEDIVQAVWLKLLNKLDTIEEPKAVAQWLITTTRREVYQSQHKTTHEQPLVDDVLDRLCAQDGLPEQEVLQRDRDVHLWTAFRKLSAHCQMLIRLTVLDGRAEYDVVAKKMSMRRGSIGPTRMRCLATLRKVLTNETEGGSS